MADAWHSSYGLDRLQVLGDHPSDGEVPQGRIVHAELDSSSQLDPIEYIQALQMQAEYEIAPELLVDRQNLKHTRDLASWMTLKPNLELLDYKDILKDELCIDERALQSFVTLVRTKPYGYHEACRVLHHLLKDHLETEWSSSASKWVHTSCTEAIEAIKNPNDWTKGSSQAYPAKGKWAWPGKGGGGKGSASSSGSWGNNVPTIEKGGGGKGSSSSSRGFR